MPPSVKDNTVSDNESKPRLCGICFATAADIRSHIIPLGEQKRIRAGDEKFYFINPWSKYLVQKSANRFWQSGILCQSCEDACAKLDRYWATFSDERCGSLVNAISRVPWVVPGVDAEHLMTFLISVLLRAHASDLSEFAEFSLGTSHAAAAAAFHSGEPSKLGFLLIAQLPKLYGEYAGLRNLPMLLPSRTSAMLSLGVFRFIIGFPGADWPPTRVALAQHKAAGGLKLSVIKLEHLPDFKKTVHHTRLHPHFKPQE